jgi:maltooligosyltrehalose trehalohydrolase
MPIPELDLGAYYLGDGQCRFRVWAPFTQSVGIRIVEPDEKLISLERDDRGYHSIVVENVAPGARYFYRLDEETERPDPASQFMPNGVHGASAVVDHAFAWEDEQWSGIPLHDYIIYELHVGTFTPEGTFEAIIPRLAELKETGITAIEIMPVAQFPGERNWGYDGVYPFAVQNSYGGPQSFKKLINACHKKSIAVVLDVVYNHFGPEGNYLRDFGPYFTGKYKTPWGDALNFDDAYSDEVREYFIQNAIYWFHHYHIDALRLDAVHAIYDSSAIPFLKELADRTAAYWTKDSWQRYLIAESDLNDSRLIRPPEVWGYGLDAQWSDDFHHSLHALLTEESDGYYEDFGTMEHLVKAIAEGFVYSGHYSLHRKRRHGNRSIDLPTEQFVVATQNHDQIGNRILGERLSTQISFEAQKLSAAVLVLSPYIPLLFMGQEYGEEAPFLYFVDHTDPALIEAVRQGRKEEFRAFQWLGDPPDPAGMEPFLKSKLQWEKKNRGKHKVMHDFYKLLLQMRKEIPAFLSAERDHLEVRAIEAKYVLLMRRWWGESAAICLFNFAPQDIILREHEFPPGYWQKVLDSSEEFWHGPGSLLPASLPADKSITVRARSMVVYSKQEEPEV